MKKKIPGTKFNCDFVLRVKGTSATPESLKHAIETFLKESVLSLLPELLNGQEDMIIELHVEELDKKKKK